MGRPFVFNLILNPGKRIVMFNRHQGNHTPRKFISYLLSTVLIASLIFPSQINASQPIISGLNLPPAQQILPLSQPYIPVILNGITVHPDKPFVFDFIVDKSDDFLQEADFQQQSDKLIRYFLAALAIDDKDMWVNLSPYEKDRILPENFARTEMGQDMLAQDYLLKQLTASLTYPEKGIGEEFWQKIYQKAYEQLGTTEIPSNIMSKVWIVPEQARIYERDHTAFILNSRLKVLSEHDFLALEKSREANVDDIFGVATLPSQDAMTKISTSLFKEIIIPAIEEEVNTGKNFANLRQIYHAVILASWYKERLKEGLLSKVYVNKEKTNGVEPSDENFRTIIYERYVETFKSGVYDLIKEIYDPAQQTMMPRKFISGGSNMGAVAATSTITADGREVVNSAMIKRKHAIMQYGLESNSPISVSSTVVIEDKRTTKDGPIYGHPDNLLPWANVVYPLPGNKVNDQDEIVAYWAMVTAVAEILLDAKASDEQPYDLNLERFSVWKALREDYHLGNITDKNLGFTVDDIFNYLVDLGFVERVVSTKEEGRLYYIPQDKRSSLSTWARLNIVIEEEFNDVFEENKLDEDALLKMIARYENVKKEDPINLVEPYQPFLRALLSLPPMRQKKILNFLEYKYFEGDKADMTGGSLVDAIMMMFNRFDDEKAKAWAKKVFPHLVQEGRTVYLVAPEITLLKGGLGRVMQYLGRALHNLGVEVVFIEPRYDVEVIFDENGNILRKDTRDYAKLSLPLHMPPLKEKEFTYTVDFDGKKVLVDAYRAINDEGISVMTFRDREGYYIQDVYFEGAGAAPKDVQALFVAKASWGLRQELDEKKKKELDKENKEYVPSVFAVNDGQTMLATMFRLFDKQYQTETSMLTHVMATGHTVLNTLQVSQEALRQAGLLEQYWWMLKNIDVYGNPSYDASKGGMMAAVLTGGAVNNVSNIHRKEMELYMPMLAGVVYAITNGDRLPLSQREGNQEFVRLGYAGGKIKSQWEALEAQMNQMDEFAKGQKRREVDEFLEKAFWQNWDDMSGKKRMNVLKEIKFNLKKKYYIEKLSDESFRRQQGFDIPKEYIDREDAYIEELATQLAAQLMKGYTGRGVEEKMSLARAHTFENLLKRAKQGIVTVLQVNKQFYPGTADDENGSVRLVNQLIKQAKIINQMGFLGKVIVEGTFPLESQLLFLGAVDIIVFDSDTKRIGIKRVTTGASETTEADPLFGLIQGPPELHGFITGIGIPRNDRKGRGTYFQPQDSSEASYAKLDTYQAKLYNEGKLDQMFLDRVNMFRAVDVWLTVINGYARLWEETIKNEEKRWEELVKSPEGLTQSLINEVQGLARPEGEVDVSGVSARIPDQNNKVDVEITVKREEGVQKVYLFTVRPPEDIELSVWVKPQGIHQNKIGALLKDKDSDNIYPMAYQETASDGFHRFVVRVPPSIWHKWEDGRVLNVLVNAGSWYEVEPIKISKRLPSWEIEEIKSHIDQKTKGRPRKFDVKVNNSTKEVNHKQKVFRGASVELEVAVPVGERTVAQHLKLGVYRQQEESMPDRPQEWSFLSSREYEVSKGVYEEGKVKWRIRIKNVNLNTNWTFALFDSAEDELDRKNVIAWANPAHDDFTFKVYDRNFRIENLNALEGWKEAGEVKESSSAASVIPPGGIKLDMAGVMARQGVGSGIFSVEHSRQVPSRYIYMDGLAPVFLHATMNVDLPVLLGL